MKTKLSLSICDIDFFNLAIAKFETSKSRIGLNETEILRSTFESTESECQQSTLQLNESKVLFISRKFH